MRTPGKSSAAIVGAAMVFALGAPILVDAPALPPATADPRPNIVLILTDDQRLNNSQLPGDTTISHMPIVQSELAGKGVTFTNGFDVNPLCCPSRSTILTGMDSGHTGVWDNAPPYGGFATFTASGDDQSTIATWLHDSGYATALVGKYLNGYEPANAAYIPPGWDTWDTLTLKGTGSGGAEGWGGYYNYSMSVEGAPVSYGSSEADYSTGVLANYATDFIRNVPDSQPLFLFFAPRAPHAPGTPEPKYSKGCPGLARNRPPNWNEPDVTDKPPYVQALTSTNRDAFNAHQCRSLLSVDDAVGGLLTTLANTGRLQNTLILYASDNGLANGEHRWKKKTVPYEESIRVPVIVRYDALTGGVPSTDSDLILNMDFAPTFAAAAGVGAPQTVQGASMMPLIAGTPEAVWRTNFLIEHGGNTNPVPSYCGIHTAQYVYVRYSDGFEEIYDLQADPYELQNIAADPLVADLKVQLAAMTVTACSPPPPDYSFPPPA